MKRDILRLLVAFLSLAFGSVCKIEGGLTAADLVEMDAGCKTSIQPVGRISGA
jgi:hypothetical protein